MKGFDELPDGWYVCERKLNDENFKYGYHKVVEGRGKAWFGLNELVSADEIERRIRDKDLLLYINHGSGWTMDSFTTMRFLTLRPVEHEGLETWEELELQ